MAYRKPLLAKILDWKKLTDELTERFRVPVEGLPHTIQTILEVASDGQRIGFKQAAAKAPKQVDAESPKPPKKGPRAAAKKSSLKKALKAVAKSNYKNPLVTKSVMSIQERPAPDETILKVMKPGETITMDEIAARVIARGWQPDSSNYKAYVQHLLSKETTNRANKGKGRVERVDVNQYRLREWYTKSLQKIQKLDKTAKQAAKVPPAPASSTVVTLRPAANESNGLANGTAHS